MLEVFTISNFSLYATTPDCLNDDEFFAKSAVLNAFLPSCCVRALTCSDFEYFQHFLCELLHNFLFALCSVSRNDGLVGEICDVVERIFLIISASMKRMNGPEDYVNERYGEDDECI